ncbi:hypothetical protein MXE95_03160 [Aeromonas caviae]|uniref:hypothetical protein n=1 Tax=Aeromonas caviae TaxID=648 RepID=UPI002DBBE5A2|nr:hypothetical protein [Aeromonas caviae]MEB5773113.1 hypothetical protein [Aeromonas caviae]MEB6648342.1 hypothetical protein [Aeromonas caviae]
MANEYYERLSEMNPGDLADGLAIEAEFDAIAQAFSKLPTPHTGGQGFDGPVRVGDAVNNDEAVSLGQLNAAIGEAVLLPIATYGNLSAAAWGSLPSNTYLLFGAGAQFSNTPYTLVAGSTYYLQVRHVIGGAGVSIYHDQLSLASTDDTSNVDLRRLFVRTSATFAGAVSGGWVGFTLKKAALTALESLSPSADQIAYYTSAGAAAMAALTPFARNLLGNADAAAARLTIGALAASQYKPRADSLNNSQGVVQLFTGDCNALLAGDFKLVDTLVALNAPSVGSQFIYVETKSIYSTGALLQVAWPYDGNGALLSRNYSQNTSTWSPWRKVFDNRNILGSVSLSGGFPAGAIIERGSNANGEYIIFADGTVIAWRSITSALTSAPVDGLNVATVQWTFPITIGTLAHNAYHAAPSRVLLSGGHPTVSTTQASFYVASLNAFTGISVTSRLSVMGRAF